MKFLDLVSLFIVLIAVKEGFYIGWPISTVENNQFLGFNARPVFSLVAEHIKKN